MRDAAAGDHPSVQKGQATAHPPQRRRSGRRVMLFLPLVRRRVMRVMAAQVMRVSECYTSRLELPQWLATNHQHGRHAL